MEELNKPKEEPAPGTKDKSAPLMTPQEFNKQLELKAQKVTPANIRALPVNDILLIIMLKTQAELLLTIREQLSHLILMNSPKPIGAGVEEKKEAPAPQKEQPPQQEAKKVVELKAALEEAKAPKKL